MGRDRTRLERLEQLNEAGPVLSITVTSPLTSTGGSTPTLGLANTAVTAGSYGDSTHVATFTVGVDGRITAAASSAIAFPVASVTGTAPVVSSGGATPAISMPAATASVDGYLSHVDWGTFNGKQNALGYTAANDASVVHLAGTETVTGAKTFNATTAFQYVIGIANQSFPGGSSSGSYYLYGSAGFGATFFGFGSVYDVYIGNRNGSLAIGILANTVNVACGGSISATSHGTPTNALGTVGATATCNFTTSALNTLTLTAATACTLSFTAPPNPCDVTVIITAPASGTVPAVTWPATVNGSPVAVTVLGKRSMNKFWYDGTRYWVTAGQANGT